MAKAAKTPEDKVRASIARLGGTPGQFIRIADLRYALAAKGLDFTTQDEILTAMYRSQQVNMTPQSNQAALTADQRATALRCGGEDKHLISIR